MYLISVIMRLDVRSDEMSSDLANENAVRHACYFIIAVYYA